MNFSHPSNERRVMLTIDRVPPMLYEVSVSDARIPTNLWSYTQPVAQCVTVGTLTLVTL
jgi:hypothetical protein